MSFDFYIWGHARNEAHYKELLTALRTFDFIVEAAYVAASVSAVPPVIITPPPESIPPPVSAKTLPLRPGGKTCQDVINVFDRAFGRGLVPGTNIAWYVQLLQDSGLVARGIFDKRPMLYTVPPYLYIEDMNIGTVDKNKLAQAVTEP